MYHFYSVCSTTGNYKLQDLTQVAPNLCLSPIPRQSVLRKASICSCPTPLAPFWPNSRWESSRCKTSMAMSWKPPSWFPPRSASTYDRRRSGSFCLMNCAAKKQSKTTSILPLERWACHKTGLGCLCCRETNLFAINATQQRKKLKKGCGIHFCSKS